MDDGVRDEYQDLVDKIGMAPNLRRSDNVFQARFVGASLVVFIALAFILPLDDKTYPPVGRLLVGALVGLLVGVGISGLILAIKNLRR
ncbi:MAG: hypothetical protein BGO01_03275 [Armatimonadetes bacterium 55-13]|nr:hypothetical protein [Armatimonadota bacterium]ODU51606.1 MAG: hypothetical protein ABT09_03595 [bacterium SCN 57-13]OJU62979.1 MAG: hypothetical protein BGO01_03275 [Armatimonadetes bacterium 55-13]